MILIAIFPKGMAEWIVALASGNRCWDSTPSSSKAIFSKTGKYSQPIILLSASDSGKVCPVQQAGKASLSKW